jgi:membrane-associated protease RseP (regulator of RpoE activity)
METLFAGPHKVETMVGTLTLVLVGLVLYTLALLALKARGRLPAAVRVSGPIVTLHTERGKAFLDRLARRRRFWRAWGNIGLGIALVVMVVSGIAWVAMAALVLSAPDQAQGVSPQNALVIPGVNDFLPLSAAPAIVLGLLLGLIVHEGGHGLLCRVEDIDIDSMGIAMLAFIPVGAFVEPDDESRQRADRGSQTRMFAAGVTNNFALTAITFLLLVGPIAGSIGVAAGVPVAGSFPGSAADEAGIGENTVLTSVNGTAVENRSELEVALDESGTTVSVGLRDGSTATVDRHLLVREAVPGVTGGSVRSGAVIETVNGTPVRTEREFAAALAGRTVAELGTDNGTVTVPVGAYVDRAAPDGPLAAAGAPTDRFLIVTAIDDRRVDNASALRAALDDAGPGPVTVTAYADGERRSFEVTLGEGGRLGAAGVAAGYSGLAVDDFGIREYPAATFLSVLDGSTPLVQGQDSVLLGILVYVGLVLSLPIFSLLGPGIAFNFAGFNAGVANFFVVEGPLGFLGGGVFLLANACFWTGWVNLNLGLFNCIPAFPLDGGHMLRTSTEAIVSRLPVPNRRTLTSAVTTTVTLTMFAALFLLFFGPQLLG